MNLVGQFLQQRLQFLIVLLVVGRQFGISLHVSLIKTDGQLVNATQMLQFHLLLTVRQYHTLSQLCIILLLCEFRLGIPQLVHPAVAAPSFEGLFRIVPALLRCEVVVIHIMITLNSQFASFGQVAIHRQERVEFLQIELMVVAVGTSQLQSRHHRGQAVAHLIIIKVQGSVVV